MKNDFISLEDISMGIQTFIEIKNKIDSIITTIKGIGTPQRAEKTSQNIELVNEEARNNNEDTVNITGNRSRESAYKVFEKIFVKYDIDITEAKESNLLENMTGYSPEELATKTEDELAPFVNALKSTLKSRKWTFWKSNKGMENLESIAKDAFNKHVDNVTGRNCWDNLCDSITGKNKNLSKRLEKAGYNEVNENNVIAFFQDQTKEAIASGDPKKIQKALDEALQVYGGILKNTENSEYKAILTAAIQELEAAKRFEMADLTIRSCGTNVMEKEVVAKGVADNYMAMACKTDALGNFTSSNDNIAISKTAIQNMNEADTIATLNNWKKQSKDLMQGRGSWISSPEERERAKSCLSDGLAGATLGAAAHSETSSTGTYDRQSVLNEVNKIAQETGLSQDVYKKVEEYLQSHPNEFPKSPNEIIDIINRATNNAYSNAISNNNNKTNSTASNTTSNQTSNDTTKKTAQKNQPGSCKKPNAAIRGESTQKNHNGENSSEEIRTSQNTSLQNKHSVSSPTVNTTNTNTTNANTTNKNSHTPNTEVGSVNTSPISNSQNAIKQGVKAVKEYAKENNVSTMELAIESLNSSSASNSTRKWALNQFEAASNSVQLLNFRKINNGTNAMAAAKTMDDRTRSQIRNFRSYYIKEAVENLDEEALA